VISSTDATPGRFNRLPADYVTDGVSIRVHRCRVPKSGWSEPYALTRNVLVIVREGGYVKCLDGKERFVGPAMAYFEPRGSQHASRHLDDGGDLATLLFMSDAAVTRLTGHHELPTEPFALPSAVDLDHRRLVRDIDDIGVDRFEAEDRMAAFVGGLVEIAGAGRSPARRSGTRRAHRRIVDVALEAVVARPADAALADIARDVGHSPFHVSRVFRQVTGVSLAAFRNQVRLAMALDRLEAGEPDLAGLAADLGFADQSHMSRVFVERLGRPPSFVRSGFTRRRPATVRQAGSPDGW
jgi:AraC-like DNA-binding protein